MTITLTFRLFPRSWEVVCYVFSWTEKRWSSLIFCQLLSLFSSFWEWLWSSTLISSHLKLPNQSKTLVWFKGNSLFHRVAPLLSIASNCTSFRSVSWSPRFVSMLPGIAFSKVSYIPSKTPLLQLFYDPYNPLWIADILISEVIMSCYAIPST